MSNKTVIDNIITARVSLLMKHSFFGNLATRMKLVDASDWCSTAATDFDNLYYNADFFSKMNYEQIKFVIAHEILHCIFDHIGRIENRDHNLWNIAADYCVNGVLKREKIGEDPPVKFFYDPKYNKFTAEQVYDELLKDNKNNKTPNGQLLDDHLHDSADGSKSRPTISKSQAKKIQDRVKSALVESAKTASAESIPEEIKKLIKELTEPQMDWKALLRQQIFSTIKHDYTWTRPNRRSQHCGAILPGSNLDTTVDVVVALDTSGSTLCANMLKDFISEVRHIMNSFNDFKLTVWCFDTKVYDVHHYDSYNSDEFTNFKISGGGGTKFEKNWEFMKDNNIQPKKFILFTDGYPNNTWGDPDYCDTIFIIHGPETVTPPWGQYAHYSKKNS